MIYVCEIREKGDKPKIWKARDVGVYQEIASLALSKRMIAPPGTLNEVMEVSRNVCEFYKVFCTEWHALDAIAKGEVPEAAAAELRDVISRHERVQMRNYLPGGLSC